jgi:hypothetical protein
MRDFDTIEAAVSEYHKTRKLEDDLAQERDKRLEALKHG